jgi:hypothetical protein
MTIETANPDGMRFSFNQITGGVPSRARKKETRNKTRIGHNKRLRNTLAPREPETLSPL